MTGGGLLWAALFVMSLFHPHLSEKWTWVMEVVSGSRSWGERFRPIDSFDLLLHTGMTLAFLFFALRSFGVLGAEQGG